MGAERMNVISSKNIIHIIRRTLNCVDKRLIGHGERVSYLVYSMLRDREDISEKKRVDIAMVALLHDIGAYKTEDIDLMVEFETKNIWEHSVYGYLYLKNLSPVKAYAKAVLYHHLAYEYYDWCNIPHDEFAQMFELADRVDILLGKKEVDFCRRYIENNNGLLFSPKAVDTLKQADKQYDILQKVKNGIYLKDYEEAMQNASFTEQEKREYLSMVAYAIDFRSEFMVLHTVTTVNVSRAIAELMHLEPLEQQKVFYGSLLHDLGKVATPVGILEKAGKLTEEEMDIMRQHVVVTGEILGDYLDASIKNIAVRHHEKLDGSGYPLGLSGDQLTVSERIVAVSDILSALVRKRSYKEAFNKDKTISILKEMMEDKKICPLVTKVVLDNFDDILAASESYSKELLALYQGMQQSYNEILNQLPDLMKKSSTMLNI